MDATSDTISFQHFQKCERFMESIKTAFGFSRRIGNTRYRANVYQAPEATESFEG